MSASVLSSPPSHSGPTRRTGISVLVGSDPEATSKERMYIGEGDNVLDRLLAHEKDPSKDFWNQAVFFISKDENLTKARVRYLERELDPDGRSSEPSYACEECPPGYALARPLPMETICSFSSALAQLILPVPGFSCLQPVPKPEQLINAPAGEDISPVFEWSQGGARAPAREYKGEFIGLNGSTARKEPKPSWTTHRQSREQLIQERKNWSKSQRFLLRGGSTSPGRTTYPVKGFASRLLGAACAEAQDQTEWGRKPRAS